MVASTIVANIFNFACAWAFAFGLPSLGLPAFGVVGLAWATNLSAVVQLAVVLLGVRGVDPGAGVEPLRRPDRAMIRRAFILGVPLGLQLLAEVGIFSLVGLLVSRMGTSQMGAHQVALTIASFTFMVPLGISMATSVQVGRAIGAGDVAAARRAGFYGIGLGGGFMLLAGLVLWLQPVAIARLMTDQPAVLAMTAGLLQIAGAFQLFDGIQCCGGGALRGAGETRWPFAANVVGYWLLGLPLGLALMGRFGPYGLWWGLTLGLAIVAVAVTARFRGLSSRPIAAVAATP
jgi:MATE family multidrug resistance protein